MGIPSHVISRANGKTTIHNLELFVGFDPTIDTDDDDRMRKFTTKRIGEVVKRTREFISRKQNPKLILGHNSDDPDAPALPVIGDIQAVNEVLINGAPGISGDVVMTDEDFREFVASNKFPRRSAEICSDNLLSEVALLGNQTPARPLPDTKFAHSGAERFSRDFGEFHFDSFAEPTETPHGPGPGNTHIPSDVKKKRKAQEMPDPTKDEKMTSDLEEMKAKLKAAEDENDELKAKMKARDDEDDEDTAKAKSKNSRLEKERDQFKRQADEQGQAITGLRKDLNSEKYSRKLDQLRNDGYDLPDERYDEVLKRIVDSADPDAEIEYFTKISAQIPLNERIDQTGARTATGEHSLEDRDRFAKAAADKCQLEGKPEMYDTYLKDAQEGN